MSWYDPDDLRMMLERTGGAVHTVDGVDLFCRVKDNGIAPDEFGRGMLATAELTLVDGDTFDRQPRHNTVVDDVTWRVAGVRFKLSGLTVWDLVREVG